MRAEGIALEAKLGPLPLIRQRLMVSSQTFELVMPSDVDQVMDLYINNGIDGDPYWTRAWPSSIALASFILSRPELVKGKRVADLGCGLGLAGIAAAISGAREVVLLDREVLALRCALASALFTASSLDAPFTVPSLEPEPISASFPSGSVKVLSSFYFDKLSIDNITPSSSDQEAQCQVKARVFDWGCPEYLFEAGADGMRGKPFDVVLACDVLYEDEAVEPIASLVPMLLSSSGSRLLLADPPNRTERNRLRFLDLVASKGIRQEELSVNSCVEAKLLDEEMAGGISSSSPVPIQTVILRRTEGNETVFLKS